MWKLHLEADSYERLLVKLRQAYEDRFRPEDHRVVPEYTGDAVHKVQPSKDINIKVPEKPVVQQVLVDPSQAVNNEIRTPTEGGQTIVTPVVPPAPEVSEVSQEGDLSSIPDVRGIPWDARIHAKSKLKNKDGTWKKKKFVTPAEVEEVERELRGNIEPLVPHHLRTEKQETPFEDAGKVTTDRAVENAQAQVKFEPIQITFDGFKASVMPTLAQMLKEKWIDQQYIAALADHFGVDQLWKILDDEEKVKAIYESLRENGLIKEPTNG